MPSSRAGCTATTPAAATTVTSCGAAPLTLCSTPTDDRGPKGFTATSTRDQEGLEGRGDPAPGGLLDAAHPVEGDDVPDGLGRALPVLQQPDGAGRAGELGVALDEPAQLLEVLGQRPPGLHQRRVEPGEEGGARVPHEGLPAGHAGPDV